MATVEQIKTLRGMIDEQDSTTYDDITLAAQIDQADGDVDLAAASIWEQKAARFSTLVDTSESGSSRSNSQVYKNARDMAAYYAGKVQTVTEVAATARPTTRTAVRK